MLRPSITAAEAARCTNHSRGCPCHDYQFQTMQAALQKLQDAAIKVGDFQFEISEAVLKQCRSALDRKS